MYGIYENGEVIAKFVAPMTIKSNHPISISDTLSLKMQATRRAVQRWEISTNLEPLSSKAQDLFVNLISKGLSETVTVLVPQNYGAKLERTASGGSPTGSGSLGATQISVSGLSGYLPKGTFIKFANHSKIYLTTGNITNSGTVGIYPALQTAVSSSIFTFKDDVLMNCRYGTETTIGMTYSDGILMDLGTVTLIEKL